MTPISQVEVPIVEPVEKRRLWVYRLGIGWMHRRTIALSALCGLVLSTVIAFTIPKQYESTVRIMPPEQGMNPAIMAALAGRALPGGLGVLAGSLLGMHSSSTVLAELVQSRTVRERIADRFELQKLYGNRYKQDTLKRLSHRTDVSEDRKTGILTITVTDTDRRRARDMAQAYIDELNSLTAHLNTSTAGRERQFIEQRLVGVKSDLDDAQQRLSVFSSKNATLDVKEQTRAMVDATAKLEGQLVIARSELSSMDQIYGPENVRVRAVRARVGELDREMKRVAGDPGDGSFTSDAPYPSLRALPALAVQWADLYRRVRTQETIYDLLTQEYELARIEEAKSIPSVSVIDAPSWPEKKSFPPRLILMLLGMLAPAAIAFAVVVRRDEWAMVAEQDPRRDLWNTVIRDLKKTSLRPRSNDPVHPNGHEL